MKYTNIGHILQALSRHQQQLMKKYGYSTTSDLQEIRERLLEIEPNRGVIPETREEFLTQLKHLRLQYGKHFPNERYVKLFDLIK